MANKSKSPSNGTEENGFVGRWWEPLSDGRVHCYLCPRHCKMTEGQRGFCFVRKNVGGELQLTTYGKSSGFCIDPIEKKPLNHFYPGSSVLSFGTAGCNLGCKYCQNWDISKSREMDRLADDAMPEQIAATAKEHGCQSVAFTYNDPVIFAEYAIDTAIACREQNLFSVAVTAGYISPEAIDELAQHLDAANVDLKSFRPQFYEKTCFARLQPVLETLDYLCNETDLWVEITTLLIPGLNDSEKELAALSDWILENLGPNVPLHFTAFHPDFKMMKVPRTPAETLHKARSIARNAGINFVYTGNVHSRDSASTWCPNCGELLVERDWYELGEYNISDGACSSCGSKVPGRFTNKRGNWGLRRKRVRIGQK